MAIENRFSDVYIRSVEIKGILFDSNNLPPLHNSEPIAQAIKSFTGFKCFRDDVVCGPFPGPGSVIAIVGSVI